MHNFDHWCRTVLAQVRFRPDHGAIERELAAHYEDHVKDLERIGYPLEEAEPKALAAMGDAEEVGRGLDRAHAPWLGRLWQLSKLTLLLAAMFAVAFMYEYQIAGMAEKIRLHPEPYFEEVEGMEKLNCPRDFESGIYTYEFQHGAYAWDGWGHVNLALNAYTPYFWIKGPELEFLTAVDSLSRTYTEYGKHNIYGTCDSKRVNTACVIEISTGEQWPEWIDVTNETAGWSFRIQLPQEGGAP